MVATVLVAVGFLRPSVAMPVMAVVLTVMAMRIVVAVSVMWNVMAMSVMGIVAVIPVVMMMMPVVMLRHDVHEGQREPEAESAVAFGAGGVAHEAEHDQDGRGAEDDLAHGVSPRNEVTPSRRVPATAAAT